MALLSDVCGKYKKMKKTAGFFFGCCRSFILEHVLSLYGSLYIAISRAFHVHHALLSSFGSNGPHLSHVFIHSSSSLFFFFSLLHIYFFPSFFLKDLTVTSDQKWEPSISSKLFSHFFVCFFFFRENTHWTLMHARLVSSSSSGQQLTEVISLSLPAWPPSAFFPVRWLRLTHVGRSFNVGQSYPPTRNAMKCMAR